MDRSVTNFYGVIVAKLEYKSNGDIVVRDFYGKILGYYSRSQNSVTDFYGRIIAKGAPEAVGILFADKLK